MCVRHFSEIPSTTQMRGTFPRPEIQTSKCNPRSCRLDGLKLKGGRDGWMEGGMSSSSSRLLLLLLLLLFSRLFDTLAAHPCTASPSASMPFAAHKDKCAAHPAVSTQNGAFSILRSGSLQCPLFCSTPRHGSVRGMIHPLGRVAHNPRAAA
jgi:hypothetical protein